jgi:hypothetical protein
MRSQEQQSTYNIQQNVRPQDRKKRLSWSRGFMNSTDIAVTLFFIFSLAFLS